MTNKLTTLAVGGITAVVVTAGAVIGTNYKNANAQTPTPTQQTQQQRPDKQALHDAFIKRLATNLGVTEDRLKAALKTTALQGVDEAVAQGRMTQEQATQARQRIEQGGGWFGPGFGGRGGPGGPGDGMMRGFGSTELAQFLGITQEQLRTELPGKSLAQVAQAHGKSAAQLKTFLTDQHKARLATAVQNGRMTQAQADQALAQFTQNLDQMINQVMPAQMPGRGR